MPARLKSFELHGYKTFATRSEFIFSDGITAIVGPNGSGKSNIADALRWVLGEQSYGLLRAKKTEDMIFAGSENRPRSGMASATVVFDNTDGWLPIDYTEVGITRRAYRDGDNEYLLNNQRVRLKDVSEVLAKSGLAERTYTIIGQGLVDAALALKAEERRRLFEEAAGIGLHRSRREEALKRLETTGRNIERVQDILAELQPRLRSLERQAKRAQEYNLMKANLKIALREWYGYHWHQAQAELVAAQITAKQHESIFSRMQADQLNLDQRLSEYRTKINDQRVILNQLHNELSGLHLQREAISREQAVNNERSRLLRIQAEQISAEKNKAEEEAGIQKAQLELVEQELAQLEKELQQATESAAEAEKLLKGRQHDRSAIEETIKSIQNELINLQAYTNQLQNRVVEKDAYCERLRGDLSNIENDISSTMAELKVVNERLDSVRKTSEEKGRISRILQDELNQKQARSEELETTQRGINERITQHKILLAKIRAEIQVIEEAETNLTGYEEGARILMQAMKEKRLEGAIGSLGNSLVVPQEYEVAVAAVLGEYIDSMVVESINQSEPALDLIGDDTIRGSVFPLDAISPGKPLIIDTEKTPVNPENILGIGANLIQSEPVLKPIVDLLFGQVIIVKDRNTARKILSSHDFHMMPNLKVVTTRGEMYLSTGPIIRGASKKGLLARPRHYREDKFNLDKAVKIENDLEQQYTHVQKELTAQQAALNEVKGRYQQADEEEKSLSSHVGQLELEAEKFERTLKWQHEQKSKIESTLAAEISELEKINNDISRTQVDSAALQIEIDKKVRELATLPMEELQTQSSYWKTNCAVTERALLDTRNRQNEKISLFQQGENNLEELRKRLATIGSEINTIIERIGVGSKEELRLGEKIGKITADVVPIEGDLKTIESEYNSLLTSDSAARQQLRVAEQQYTQAKITLARLTESFENLRSHIEDDFGLVSFDYTETVSGPKPLPLEGLVEELPKVENLSPEIEESIRQQKALIRRMGAINIEAQNEYQEVKDRYEFLSSQIADLTKAQGDIRDVITELDILMEREFRRTFEAVAQEFKQIFTRLFGGGSARLALTDPENITETGIDIEARLPGRREQGLALLSGGERSLTATALVFALLRVSPTPFCILDEVDAMLDEANVGRFRDLLTELSEKTQFIVITHNRNTVQAASIIYGVTMGRDSASQVISLRMDELGEEFGV